MICCSVGSWTSADLKRRIEQVRDVELAGFVEVDQILGDGLGVGEARLAHIGWCRTAQMIDRG